MHKAVPKRRAQEVKEQTACMNPTNGENRRNGINAVLRRQLKDRKNQEDYVRGKSCQHIIHFIETFFFKYLL